MQTIITIGETTYNTGIASGSLYLQRTIADGDFDLGLPIANRFEVQMYGIEDVSGQTIQVHQVDDEGLNPVYLFYGIIDSAKQDANGYYRNIVAYDVFYAYRNTDVSYWWESFWQLRTSATIKEIRLSLLDYMEIEEADEEVVLPNDDIITTKAVEFSTLPFGDMLHLICQAQAVFPNIDAQGKLEYIIPTSDTTSLDHDDYRIADSQFEEYSTPTYQAIKIYSGSTVKYAYGVGTPFVITDNVLIMKLTASVLNTVCQNIIQVLANIHYNPCDIVMIQTNNTISLGDKITSEKGSHFAFSIVTRGVQFLEQTISCEGSENTADSPIMSLAYIMLQNDIQEVIESGALRNYEYQNGNVIQIGNNQRRRILSLRMAATQDTRVDIHIEVNLSALCISPITVGTSTVDNISTKVLVEYSVDSVFQPFTPQETYIDGNHVLHLMYILPISAYVTSQFMVYLTVSDGAVTIPRKGVWAYASGLGIVGDGVWDGTFDIEDPVEQVTFPQITWKDDVTDSVTVATQTPTGVTLSDTATMVTFPQITWEPVNDRVRTVIYSDAYIRGTEDGDTRLLEETVAGEGADNRATEQESED